MRNITDAGHLENDAETGEDRIAKKARLEEIEPMEVVQKYTVDFHNTLQKFNNLPPSIEPTATGHIVEQIEIIKNIIDKGLAYEANGSVYFDVLKYNESNEYGILSGRKLEDMIANTRELAAQSDKKNHRLLLFSILYQKNRAKFFHQHFFHLIHIRFFLHLYFYRGKCHWPSQ